MNAKIGKRIETTKENIFKNILTFIWWELNIVLYLLYQKHTTMTYRISKLLTTNNHKTIKGEKLGYITYIMYLSPFTDNSKGINLCPFASKGCSSACLFNSGFGGMYAKVREGRQNKTEWFLQNRPEFLAKLDSEIAAAVKRHEGKDNVTIRLNGTSDIRWEKFPVRDGKNIFELYPKVKFYDYTKNYKRFDSPLPKNYSLTFSRSEDNEEIALGLLARGFNVAVVFDKLPKTYKGFKVIVGDETDLRFKDPKGVIVGLTYKSNTGKGSEIDNRIAFTSGFALSTKNIPA